MFTILDRYILRSLIINYAIGLGVMLSLYVVLDLFVNMDEFIEQDYPMATVAENIVRYYGPNLLLYFSQLSGVITLFACLAAIARMRRQNELTAILASGVSLYRVAAPVLAFGLVMTAFLVLDTEVLIPSVAYKLARDHDDVDGKRTCEVLFLKDRNDALLSAGQFHPGRGDLKQLLVLVRDSQGHVVETIEADHADWEPPTIGRPIGRWRLQRGMKRTRVRTVGAGLGPQQSVVPTLVQFYESDLSPEAIQLRQSEGWIRFMSLRALLELKDGGTADPAAIVQVRHARTAAPLVGIVLLLLGLPFFLDRSPVNMLSDTAKCMVACGLCYVSTFVAQSIRLEAIPALPAWIPIFVFATLAMVLIDRIRT